MSLPPAERGLRGRLLVDASLLADEGRLLSDVSIAGLPLLSRQLRCLRDAGIDAIDVTGEAADLDVLRRALARLPRAEVRGARVTAATRVDAEDAEDASDTLTLPAGLIIDPRALRQAIQLFGARDRTVIVVDRFADNYPASAKSPFIVGAPGGQDGRTVESSEASEASKAFDALGRETLTPIGITLQRCATAGDGGSDAGAAVLLDVGRYAWHRVRSTADAREATWKVLLSTIKPTDGMYARTNRRVSLRISRLLLPTSVTPNQVTLFTLVCSGIAGAVMAGGSYLSFVAGGFLTWFASMLDGVDGELARAKFEATELGHWLEMACDYAFYLAVVSGYGVGFYRASGSPVWLQLALAGLVGVVLSFAAVAYNKRDYARREPDGEYYVAFQRTTSAHASNPVHLFTRYCTFLVSRGAFPYFITAFAVLGLSKLMFLMVLVGTHLSWMLTLYAGRLKPSLTPTAPAAPVRARPAAEA
ncbi:MAG: CDP-alcohol phosphatidyltransferase family protein [Vicinamibacterales bacterium]